MSLGAPLPDLERLTRYDGRLRGVAADEDAVRAALADARALLDEARSAGDVRSELPLLGYVGTAHRLLAEGEAAAACLEAARCLARELGDRRAEVVALVRLGEARRCAGRPEDGERLLREAATAARAEAPTVLHFALQHLGKCLLELGRRGAARASLTEALELRRELGDAALVASTEAALRLLAREE